jgi:hypothetical protein
MTARRSSGERKRSTRREGRRLIPAVGLRISAISQSSMILGQQAAENAENVLGGRGPIVEAGVQRPDIRSRDGVEGAVAELGKDALVEDARAY